MQDEIRVLETQLWKMDEKDKVNNPHRLGSRQLDDAYHGTRRMVMDKIQHKLVQYGKYNVEVPVNAD